MADKTVCPAAAASHPIKLVSADYALCYGKVHALVGRPRFPRLDLPAAVDERPRRIVQAAVGGKHAVLLDAAGVAHTCGAGEYGQLGRGLGAPNVTIPAPVSAPDAIAQVAAGKRHTVLLDRGGRVYTFGDGRAGQLGLGDTFPRFMPTFVRGPEEAIMRGQANMISRVAAAGKHTLLLSQSGRVYGSGTLAQSRSDFAPLDAPPLPSGERPRIVQIAAGKKHAVLLGEDGSVFTCGRGSKGQLGLGDRRDRLAPQRVSLPEAAGAIVQVSAGDKHTALLDAAGRVYVCGADQDDRLVPTLEALPPHAEKVAEVLASGRATLLLSDSGRVARLEAA